MRRRQRTLLAAVAVLLLAVGPAAAERTAASGVGPSAPDCGSVSYDGAGTATNPYEVATVAQLQCLGQTSINASYEQVGDIDASATADWNDGHGFAPLTEFEYQLPTEFNGTYDGNGYRINDLFINRSGRSNVGVFAAAGPDAHIHDVHLQNVTITGRNLDSAGGLVGISYAKITDSSVTGAVQILGGGDTGEVGGVVGSNYRTVQNVSAAVDLTGTDGDPYAVGGLVGRNFGETANNIPVFVPDAKIRASTATGTVSVVNSADAGGLVGWAQGGTVVESAATGSVTADKAVGGLVGAASEAVTIRQSYATGNTTGRRWVGGLIGDGLGSQAAIQQSYATGDVRGTRSVGGLVGSASARIDDSYATGTVTGDRTVGGLGGSLAGDVNRSYAAGNVTGEQKTGGLVGTVYDSTPLTPPQGALTVRHSYWDRDTTGQTSSADGTGLATDRLKGNDSLAGFDFQTTWSTRSGTSVSYPFLQNNSQRPAPGLATAPLYAGGTGTASDPYQIATWTHLNNTRQHPGANFTLVADLNESTPGYDAVAGPGANNGSGFLPVGRDTNRSDPASQGDPFTGTFDGAGHSITDLRIDRPTARRVGLFGRSSGTLTNVSVGATVTGDRGVGSLVGTNDGTVRGANATATVTGRMDVGGLVGTNEAGGVVNHSAATGRVTGFRPRGCTAAPSVDFVYRYDNATDTVTVIFTGGETFDTRRVSFAGAVSQAGQTWATVAGRPANRSRITAGDSVTLDTTPAGDGDVRLLWHSPAETDVVIGRSDTNQFTDSGVRCEDTNFGGLVGTNNGTVERGSTDSTVSATERVGGVVGYNTGLVTDGTATGNTSGGLSVGGVVGENSASGTVTESFGRTPVTRNVSIGLPVVPEEYTFTYEYRADTETITVELLSDETLDPERVSFVGDVAQEGQTWREVTGNESNITSGDTVTLNSTAGDRYQLTFAWTAESVNTSVLLGERTAGPNATTSPPLFNIYQIRNLNGLYGGLVGSNNGTIAASNAAGNVSAPTPGLSGGYVGGLVGANRQLGTVTNSTATGAVRGKSNIGGLAGINIGETVSSSASGPVTGRAIVGGLVGSNINGTIAGSSATGAVRGGVFEDSFEVGGLVGVNSNGTVTNSSATGKVNASRKVGGLIGTIEETGTVKSSSATGNVSGMENDVGGLVGKVEVRGAVETSYATGNVSGDFGVGGLVGRNNGTVDASYAIGTVAGNGAVGGLVGLNRQNGTVESSYAAVESVVFEYDGGALIGSGEGQTKTLYWDTNTTGLDYSADGTGLTTGEMTGLPAKTNMPGLDFTTTWQVVPGGYPALAGVESVGPPPVTDALDSPTDPDNDGRYEDVRGDGAFSILDVQTLFNNLDAPVVQDNAAQFRFAEVGTEVTVLDVQGLFNELQSA
jgi:hypothetical protein